MSEGQRSPQTLYRSGELFGGEYKFERSRPTGNITNQPAKKKCCWCWGDIEVKRRRSWCSKACVDEYNYFRTLMDPQGVRRLVTERDKGVCAICGVDTVWLRQQIWPKAPTLEFKLGYLNAEDAMLLVAQAGWAISDFKERIDAFEATIRDRGRIYSQYPWMTKAVRGSHLFEVDHILPVIEGGGCSGLDNFRTLCLDCHKQETAALAARRARQPKKNQRRRATK